MRNGIRFNKLRLVDNSSAEADDDPAAYFPYRLDAEGTKEPDAHAGNLFYVFLTLSITCAAATVVTGSYALWLARQQAARQALTDVNDILRSCQSRMSQLEQDVQRLPNRQA